MTTAPDPMDAVYHTLMRECADIEEGSQCAWRLYHLLRPRSQNERAVHDERRDLSSEGGPLLAVPGILHAASHNEPC